MPRSLQKWQTNKRWLSINLELFSEGEQSILSPNIPVWYTNSFELKLYEKQPVQEGHFTHLWPPESRK